MIYTPVYQIIQEAHGAYRSPEQNSLVTYEYRSRLFKSYCIPLEKAMTFHLTKLEYLLPKDILCEIWLKLVQKFSRKDFKILSMCFRYHHPKGRKMAPYFEQTAIPYTLGCFVPRLV